jgi:hypothetical protein
MKVTISSFANKDSLRTWLLTGVMMTLIASLFFLSSCDDDNNDPAAPKITFINPTSAPEGTTVTLTGENFSSNATVKFGAQTAVVASATATQIITTVPTGLSVGSTTVTVTANNKTSAGFTFQVTAEAPVITGINPLQGAAGTSVTITGENFSDTDSENAVKFGTAAATVSSATATQIVVTVPDGLPAGAVSVSVTVGGQTATATQQFTVVEAEIPVKTLYWMQQDETNPSQYDLVKGYKDENDELKIVELYTAETEATISGIALDKSTDDIYWVEQVFDVSTFSTVSKIYKGDTLGSAAAVPALTINAEVNDIAIDAVNDKIYWINTDPNVGVSSVWKGDLDGSDTVRLFKTSPYKSLIALALDTDNSYVYFVDRFDQGGAGTEAQTILYRGATSGTGTPIAIYDEDDTSHPATNDIVGVAVNGASLYIASQGQTTSEILVGNKDGSTATLEKLYEAEPGDADPLEITLGLTIDPETGYLYWINAGSAAGKGTVYRGDVEATVEPEKLFENLKLPMGLNPVEGRKKTKPSAPVAITL